jgi:CRP-like cAMP-binding protein
MSTLQHRSGAAVTRFPLQTATQGTTRDDAAGRAPLDKKGAEHIEALRLLESIGSPLHFKRNETIFAEGDESHHVYRVAHGATRTGRVLMDGRRQIAGFGLPGDFLGLDWQPVHSLTAEAVTDLVIVSYPRSQIERLGDSNPALRHEIMQLLVNGLSDTQARLVMLGRQTALERMAWFLVRKAQRLHAVNGLLDLPMSRLDIADYLGLTIETVSRVLSQLKKQHLIVCPNAHQIRLTNRGVLESLARGEMAAA